VQRIDIPVTFRVPPDGASVTIETSAQTRTLSPGEWSDWWVLDFPVNFLVDRISPLRGMVKFKVLSTSPSSGSTCPL